MKAQLVVFLSDDYFRLAAARPDIKSALALGSQVTLVVDGKAYQVVAEGQNSGPVELPSEAPDNPPTLAHTTCNRHASSYPSPYSAFPCWNLEPNRRFPGSTWQHWTPENVFGRPCPAGADAGYFPSDAPAESKPVFDQI